MSSVDNSVDNGGKPSRPDRRGHVAPRSFDKMYPVRRFTIEQIRWMREHPGEAPDQVEVVEQAELW